ncbi:MAG: hypothetical protein JWM27_1607 [Gemmatimonadetes bacterium]|nr:hypothetical protein [Gemmatimonadota bacterium]
MLRARAALAALLVVLAAAASACASGAAGSQAGSANSISVRVNNDLVVPSVLSVYILNDLGQRRLIGSVPSNGSTTLRYDASLSSGRYRLLARTTGGAEIASNPITVSAGETLVWRLASNIVTVE